MRQKTDEDATFCVALIHDLLVCTAVLIVTFSFRNESNIV